MSTVKRLAVRLIALYFLFAVIGRFVEGMGALSRRLAPSTLRSTYSFLRSVFTAAVDEKLISSSPCPRRPVMPPKPRKKIVPLTVDQVRDLAAAMPPRYRAMIIVQAGLGLRIGEVPSHSPMWWRRR